MTTTTTKYNDQFGRQIKSYQVKVYIEDNGVKASNGLSYTRNPEWVDFSDYTNIDGKNLLKTISSIQHTTEDRAGTGMSYSKTGNITFNNSNNFFDKPFPSTLKTIYGNTAQFSTSKSGSLSVIYDHKAQIRLAVFFDNGSSEEGIIGTFKINSIKKTNTNSNVIISVKDLSQKLRIKNSAERVKDGLNWYQNKPIRFLLIELLRDNYYDKTSSSGDLPSTFVIPDSIDIPTAGTKLGSSGDNRALSIISRPPDINSSTGTYLNEGMIARSIIYVPSTSTNLTSGLYCGCDNATKLEFWRYSHSTDQYTLVQNNGSDWSLSGYFMWRLWYDSSSDKLIFVAIQKSSVDAENTRKCTAKFYEYDGTDITLLTSTANGFSGDVIDDFFPGDFFYRSGNPVTKDWLGRGDKHWRIVGYAQETQYGENIPLPFRQKTITTNTEDTAATFQRIRVGGHALMGALPASEPYVGESEIGGDQYIAAFAVHDSVDPPPLGVRASFGQSGFCVYNQENKKIVYFTITEAGAYATRSYSDVTTQLMSFDVNTKTTYTIDSNLRENTARVDPLCGCSGGPTNHKKDSVFFGAVAWWNTADKRSETLLYEVDLSTNVGSKIYSSELDSTNGNSFTPIWMAFNDYNTGYPIKIISFNRDKINSNAKYSLYSHEVTNQDSLKQYYGKKDFKYLPTCLTFDSNHVMYFVSNGQMYKCSTYGSGASSSEIERPLLVDYGFIAVDDELYTACDALAIDEETRGTGDSAIIYGVSSPAPSIYGLLNTTPVGKYYLYKLEEYLSDRIELADFSGMSRWDAIEALTMLGGLHAGFDVEGNFVIVEDTQENTEDFLVENSGTRKRLVNMEVDSNENEVYNFVQVTPYATKLEEPSIEFTLIQRTSSEKTEVSRGTIEVSQEDTRKKRVQLKCLTDGRLSDIITNKQQGIFFIYRSFGEKFETVLKSAATSGSEQIYIRSGIEDVEAGDTVKIISEVNDTEQSEEFTIISDPTTAEKEEGIINLDDELEYNHPVNSFVEVSKSYEDWSNILDNPIEDSFFSKWGTEADSQLEEYTNTSANTIHRQTVDGTTVTIHPIGGGGSSTIDFNTFNTYVLGGEWLARNPLKFGGNSVVIKTKASLGADTYTGIYQSISAEKLKGGTIHTVWCYVRTHPGDDKRSKSTFKLQVKKGSVTTTYDALPTLSGWTDITNTATGTEFLKVSGTFTTPGDTGDTYSADDITIGLLCAKNSSSTVLSGLVVIDSLYIKEGYGTNQDYLVISQFNKYYRIGSTNVSISFQAGSPEFDWITGDLIDIDCPGLSLEAQDQNINTSMDPVSISVYGKKEFSDVNNRFITRQLADQISRRILEDYKWPHYKIKVNLPIVPKLNFINSNNKLYRVDVSDKETFIESGGWKQQCYIKGITHEPRNGRTTLTLRGVNHY